MLSHLIQKSFKSQKGQALSEMLLALPVCLLMLAGLALSFERAFWYFYGDHLLYESLMCSGTYSRSECIDRAETSLKPLNFMQRQYSFEISSDERTPRGTLKVQLPIELKISKRIKIIL